MSTWAPFALFFAVYHPFLTRIFFAATRRQGGGWLRIGVANCQTRDPLFLEQNHFSSPVQVFAVARGRAPAPGYTHKRRSQAPGSARSRKIPASMESLLSSPSDTIRNSAEAMAELHECLVGMARRESVLRTQLEEASAEHAIALSRATDLTEREASASAAATSATEKAAVAAGLGTSEAKMRADLGAELGSQLRDGLAQGLAQAQQGVLHLQSDLQSAREERERHDAELVALSSQHGAQMDSMRSTLAQTQRAADAELSELRRRTRGRIEAWRALPRCTW